MPSTYHCKYKTQNPSISQKIKKVNISSWIHHLFFESIGIANGKNGNDGKNGSDEISRIIAILPITPIPRITPINLAVNVGHLLEFFPIN
jgi:hypothetical protein